MDLISEPAETLIWRHHPWAKPCQPNCRGEFLYPYLLYLNADSMYNCCGASSCFANAALDDTLCCSLCIFLNNLSSERRRSRSYLRCSRWPDHNVFVMLSHAAFFTSHFSPQYAQNESGRHSDCLLDQPMSCQMTLLEPFLRRPAAPVQRSAICARR